jgi:ligand-binding sensor domain-containing protein
MRRIVLSLLCLLTIACTLSTIGREQSTPSPATPMLADAPPPTWTMCTNGNDVNDLAFDQEGNLWAATSGGLVKWMTDGTYTKYTTLDGLPDNDIQDIATAPDGTVWLGLFDNGLVRFDGKDWTTYTAANGLPDSRVWDVAVTPDGTVWVSTYNSGVSHFDPAASSGTSASEHDGTVTSDRAWTTYTTADGLLSNDAYRIVATDDGIVWAVADRNVASRFDPAAAKGHDEARWITYTINDNASIWPNATAAAADGTVWVSTRSDLAHFDGVDWQTYTNDSLSNISAIAVADDGSVWGTGHYGIFHFEESASEGGAPGGSAPGGAWTTYAVAQTGALWLRSIAIAPDGSIWVSRHIPYEKSLTWIGLGVARFDPAALGGTATGEAWTIYATDDELVANRVDYTAQTADGMLWFFTEGGPSCHSGKEWVSCPGIEQGAPIGPSVTQAPDGALWSLNLSSVIRFDPGAAPDSSGESWIVYDDFPGSSLGNLTIAPNGSVWVGIYTRPMRGGMHLGHGVARFDGTSWQVYTTTHGLAHNYVNDIAIATDGAVWFGTDNGISRFDGETWTTYDVDTILPTNNRPHTRRVITTPDGLVCCELIGAVSCFNGQDWTAYTEADGLYPEHDSLGIGINFILSTAVDRDGALWLGTNKGGVSRFDGETWTTYTTEDGLGHNQVNTIAVAPDGAVWVGTLWGASRFDGKAWTTYTTADGAPSASNGIVDNIVTDIVVTPDGALWFSTYSGISRYGPPR